VSLCALTVLSGTQAPPASALTEDTTVSSEIGSIISLLTTSGTVNIDATPDATGVQTTDSDTVTVSTNNATGYTLQLEETVDGETALEYGANSIAATTGTWASPTALVANRW